MKIRAGDDVIVLRGKHKGTVARVERVLARLDKVILKDVNVVKRHVKPRKEGESGAIIEKTMPLNISAVSHFDAETKKPFRVRYEIKDGKKVRVSTKTGAIL